MKNPGTKLLLRESKEEKEIKIKIKIKKNIKKIKRKPEKRGS